MSRHAPSTARPETAPRRAVALARRCGRLVAAGVACAAALAWAEPLVVPVPDGGAARVVVGVPLALERVVVGRGGELVADAPLSVLGDFTVQAGGRVTQTPGLLADGGVRVLRLDVAGAVLVEAGGAIDLLATGLPPQTTIEPVTGRPMAARRGVGGSHLALGANALPSEAYDEVLDPRLPGAGGEDTHGGGALALRAARLVLDGTLRADGPSHPMAQCRTFAAGGALALAVGAFEGQGELSARGGGGASCQGYAVPGAGGLVRVATGASSFTGRVDVSGGVSGGGQSAQAGTALLVDPDGGVTVLAGTYRLRGVEVLPALALASGSTLEVAGPVTVSAPVAVGADTTVRLASPQALAGLTLVPRLRGHLVVDADLDAPGGDLELGEGAKLVVNRRLSLGALDVERGAVVTSAWGVTTMDLVARRAIRVREGARVDVSGCGLPPNRSIDPLTAGVVLGSSIDNGGSHGGLGGRWRSTGTVAPVYDAPEAPRLPGGGGGCDANSSAEPATDPGAAGGGVLRLAAPLVQVDGALLADGLGSTYNECGSGAGGSLVVQAGTLSGGGTIAARGGSARTRPVAGGGGGGLVHLTFGLDAFDGGVSASGGVGEVSGGDGHVRRQQRDVAPVIVSRPPREAWLARPLRSLAEASGAGPFEWTLASGPAGATLDAATGLLAWTPPALGRFDFVLAVQGPLGGDEQAFSVEVVDPAAADGGPPRAPRFGSTPDTAGRCGVPYRYSGAGAPVLEGTAPFAFAVEPLLGVPLPRALRVDAATGEFHWTPSRADVGAHPLRLTARNDAGLASQDFAIVVECPEPAAFASACGCRAHDAAAGPVVLALGLALVALAGPRRARRGGAGFGAAP